MKHTNHLGGSDTTDRKSLRDQHRSLHKKFVKLGKNRHKITYQLLEILPEIYANRVHIEYGFETIYEYAGRLAGLSKSVVEKVLRVEPHLAEKPHLKKAIGKVGIHKIDMVARIATPETEQAWAEKAMNMSKPALQVLAKEVRTKENAKKALPEEKFEFGKCEAVPQYMRIELDEEMQFLFLKMKNKYGKKLSNKAVMKILLKKMVEQEFAEEKTEKIMSAEQMSAKEAKSVATKKNVTTKVVTRYIPAARKREALHKTHGRCAYPNCGKPAEHIHHPERFSRKKSHQNLKPICRIHHEFAHNGLIINERKPVQQWRLRLDGHLDQADQLYLRYRKRLA